MGRVQWKTFCKSFLNPMENNFLVRPKNQGQSMGIATLRFQDNTQADRHDGPYQGIKNVD